MMIVVGILEGYSASSRSRTIIDVYEEAEKLVGLSSDPTVMGHRASFFLGGSKKLRKYVVRHAHPKASLLLIGKSYGAKKVIQSVVNKIPRDIWKRYNSTFLVTVDPNWPTWKDLIPNLNDRVLLLDNRLTRGRNIYLVGPKDIQAGCRVAYFQDSRTERFFDLENYQIKAPYTHYSIIDHPLVKEEIRESLALAAESLTE